MMHHIQLNDELFEEAKRRAVAAGFQTVDEYVADFLQHDVYEESEDLDHLFTPERLAHIDRATAQIDAGRGLTPAQVEAELAKSRAQWLKQNGR